jgi:hypothetical protein
MPNDELEQDRLDMSHALMTKAIGDKLFLAPIDTDKMHRVLDIGTGTGICTTPPSRLTLLKTDRLGVPGSMAMGDEYPNVTQA